MDSSAASSADPRLPWRMGMSLFALLGGLVALYLWLYHLGLSSLICPIAGCEKVQASPYSSLLGVPVAAIGFFAFLGLFGLGLAGVLNERLRPEHPVLLVSSFGLLAYLWFTYLELFVIRAVCFWCVTSSLFMLGVWACALVATRLRVSGRPPTSDPARAR